MSTTQPDTVRLYLQTTTVQPPEPTLWSTAVLAVIHGSAGCLIGHGAAPPARGTSAHHDVEHWQDLYSALISGHCAPTDGPATPLTITLCPCAADAEETELVLERQAVEQERRARGE